MKKLFFTLFIGIFLISCTSNHKLSTYIVVFKNGTEIEVEGRDSYASDTCFAVVHVDGGKSVFNKDEVQYIKRK